PQRPTLDFHPKKYGRGLDHAVAVGENPAKVLDVFSPIREEYKY
ncbi:unnamed protein product, partial [marine sediment metagenome]